MSRYFDAESGGLGARLRELVGDAGKLTHVFQQHMGPHYSMLAETLVKHVGEQNPLFRLLSPTNSQGLVFLLGERQQQLLQKERSDSWISTSNSHHRCSDHIT